MAEKLKIIPLGGLDEIGKNMTVYECSGEIIVVDCGMAFPGDDMYGIDSIIPDVSYLIKNKSRIRGLFITHGHEDHIGAIPYVLKQVNMPIYCTRFTAGLIRLKLEEHGLVKSTKLITVEAGETVRAGKFNVEFIHVNHSIADSVSFAIHTRLGTVVHTGDFKIDSTPIDGDVIDLARFGELGKEGVLALLADSTNVERPGYTPSEKLVGKTFMRQFQNCKERIIVTTFASNVHRIQQVLDAAAACGRKVAVTGRSMENMMKVSTDLGYMHVPKNTLMDITKIKGLPQEKQVIVTTGSQGEEMSALYRMAFSTHKQVEIGAGDKVIISASAIPGNEVTIGRVINELFRKGANVVYDRADMLHVSGHACQEELKIIHALTKPRFFIPLHGEQRMLQIHSQMAQQMGMERNHIAIAENGSVIEVTAKTLKLNGVVPAGEVYVDGSGVGDVGAVVMRDRKRLAEDGMVVVVLPISSHDGQLISPPEIITRGFIYVKESNDMMNELQSVAQDAADVASRGKRSSRDDGELKSAVKSAVSNYLFKTTKRNPMVIPVVTRF
jgi:ribonuclease J